MGAFGPFAGRQQVEEERAGDKAWRQASHLQGVEPAGRKSLLDDLGGQERRAQAPPY